MKMVVTDLTRMRSGHICVAGIDLETGHRVRPMNQQLRARLLRTHGGPFDIRAIVDLGQTRNIGKAPEIEDVHFNPRKCVDCGDMPPDEFIELCKRSVSGGLSSIGPDLIQVGRSLVTPAGRGVCSLLLLRSTKRPRIFIDPWEKLRFTFSNNVELSVTDVRLYNEALTMPDPRKLTLLNSRLDTSSEVILSFGLGRAWQQPNDSMKRHYLQLNNIHLGGYPAWQLFQRPGASSAGI
ncbi:MAG: hypothetical protein ACC652_14525 [Acidimicrobiales bacterium]